jgi:hypothetical protein
MFRKTSWFVAAAMMTIAAPSGCRGTRPELPHYPAPLTSRPSAGATYPGADAAPVAAEAWVCPMHPRMRQSTPGKCSICGMDLVRSDELSPDGEPSSGSRDPHSRESGHSRGCGSGCSGGG